MRKYFEVGFGNTWFLRTEFELVDGSEYEEKGWVGKIEFISLYLRIWLNQTVIIIDTKEGFKFKKKNERRFKLIIGICSY